jgi:hypothetical protein
MRIRLLAVLLGTATIGACVWNVGGSEKDVEELVQVQGIAVYFSQDSERKTGELLGFRGDTAFVFADQQIRALHGNRLFLRAREVTTFSTQGTSRAELRSRARYPNGITTELEATLLARVGQTATLR